MDHHIDPAKTAFTLGAFIGGFHLVWSILVALGWAQVFMDFIFWAHMIDLSFVVKPFDLTAAAMLVVVTWALGCVFGYILAHIWNRMHRG